MNWHMDHYIVKKQTHVKNTMINSIIDDNGNIIDKKIEEDVNRKVEWIYIHEKLYFARRKVKRLKLYKKKIVEMNEALDNDDVERVIDIMCFEEKREIVPDPLEKKLKRYWSIDGNSSFQWKTMEEKKEETRKLYQTRGIDCFKQNAKRYAEISSGGGFEDRAVKICIENQAEKNPEQEGQYGKWESIPLQPMYMWD